MVWGRRFTLLVGLRLGTEARPMHGPCRHTPYGRVGVHSPRCLHDRLSLAGGEDRSAVQPGPMGCSSRPLSLAMFASRMLCIKRKKWSELSGAGSVGKSGATSVTCFVSPTLYGMKACCRF